MRSATRLWVPLELPRHFGAVRGDDRRWLDLQASGLCSPSATANLKMKEGGAHSLHMLWHRRSDALGAAAHGSGACCASPLRHLRAGVAAHSGGAAARRRSYVDSRFSLKQRPRLLCGGMASAQGFLSTWSLEPTATPEEVDRDVLPSPAPEIHLSVARCCCRQDPAASRGGPWR